MMIIVVFGDNFPNDRFQEDNCVFQP